MLTYLNNDDTSYNYIYNVAIRLTNGDKMHRHTFSGQLENVDNKYFWFRIDGAIACVLQETVEMMIPIEKVEESE